MSTTESHEVETGIFYTHHPHHRNQTPQKSQWSIPETSELGVFARCRQETWYVDGNGWGLHFVEGAVRYLGVGQDHATRVFIAKFVANSDESQWHGYPADHIRRSDRPCEQILRQWLGGEVLPPAKIRKISKGQPCRLSS